MKLNNLRRKAVSLGFLVLEKNPGYLLTNNGTAKTLRELYCTTLEEIEQELKKMKEQDNESR